MLHSKQRRAIRLLFELPEEKVAEELGIRLDTLRRWKAKKEFVSGVEAVSAGNRQAVCRILSRGLAHAAARVCGMVAVDADESPTGKLDSKIMVDMLKASGLLEAAAGEADEGDALAAVLAEIATKHGAN